MKALTAVEKKIAPMREVMVKVAVNIAHFRHQIKPVTDTINGARDLYEYLMDEFN